MKQFRTALIVMITCIVFFSTASLVAADETGYLRVAYPSTSLSTIDQALVSDNSQYVESMNVGVLRQNEFSGALEFGMATDQQMSEDGTVFTYKLLENVPWVRYNPTTDQVEKVLDCDGNVRMVKAQDFVYAVERVLRPSTAADYAYILSLIKGAEEYNTATEGTVSFDTVGVKALDDYTIQYTFKDPGVFNINILSMWMIMAQPSWIIEGDACNEKLGEKWVETGNYQSYGPFTLKEWVHDSNLTLIKNPYWPGTESVPQAKLSGVHIAILEDSAALAEFEAGNMDVAKVPISDYDRIVSDPVLSKMAVEVPGDIGTEFLTLNPTVPPTDDVRVRKALSMSVDKQAIVKTLKTGKVASIFIHPALSGAPHEEDFPELGIDYDPEGAKQLIQSYCDEKGIEPKDITISFIYPTREDLKIYVEAIQFMWQNTLGINVNLKNTEWDVFKVERMESKENVYRSTWTNDYMDANNFTADMFLCGATIQKIADWPSKDCTDVSNPAYQDYAQTVIAAGKETDPAKRAALYAHSEEIIVSQEVIIIPVYYYTGLELRNPKLVATVSNTGNNRWEKWEFKED